MKQFICYLFALLSISISVYSDETHKITRDYAWSDFDWSWNATTSSSAEHVNCGTGFIARRYIFCPNGGFVPTPVKPYLSLYLVFKESEAITLSLLDHSEEKNYNHLFPPYGTYDFIDYNGSNTISKTCGLGTGGSPVYTNYIYMSDGYLYWMKPWDSNSKIKIEEGADNLPYITITFSDAYIKK